MQENNLLAFDLLILNTGEYFVGIVLPLVNAGEYFIG